MSAPTTIVRARVRGNEGETAPSNRDESAGARERSAVLSIVIPALNEEEALGATIARCLQARGRIVRLGGVSDVEVLVVSDGSSDRTEEIARSFPEVYVLAFEVNRGYGAAIKCGFEHARGDYLAFLDADGTCDPEIFAELLQAMHAADADLVLGSRMGKDSQMPWLRAFGNRLFAWLLSALSLTAVRDTASGMRVIRRSALQQLYPLPDGLHFTPAMSARALLEGKLTVAEHAMPYAERVGRSKLSVVRDGIRFLSTIAAAAMTYRPARLLLTVAALCGLAAALVGSYPVAYYALHRQLEEWVIYRILLSSLLWTAGAFLTCAAVVADRIASAAHGRWIETQATSRLHRAFASRAMFAVLLGLCALAVAIVAPGICEFFTTGLVYMHWSRAVLSSLLVVTCLMLGITAFLLRMMDAIEERRQPRSGVRAPDRMRPPVLGRKP